MNIKPIILHTAKDFEAMQIAGRLAADTLDYIEDFVKPGISTLELNDLCHNFIIKHGGISAPLGYHGFPKSICTSVNHVVCHGIPSANKILKDGDIIGIDVTPKVDGWHGDSCRTFAVGDSFIQKKNTIVKAALLVKATYKAMMMAIETVKPGGFFSDIGKTIEKYVKSQDFEVVHDYGGHGTGKVFHAPPSVSHYYDRTQTTDIPFKPGMIFTIEPMVNVGDWQVLLSNVDGWTVTTKDKTLSAQFEHTVGVTDTGYQIFTKSQMGRDYQKILDQW